MRNEKQEQTTVQKKNARWPNLIGLLLAIGLALPLWAQTTTARLSGAVAESSGAAIPGASVTVKDTATGYSQTVKANTSGEYLFPSLPVGNYDMTVATAGFSPYIQNGIVLSVGQTVSVHVQLQVASVSQQVTVTANASMVTTDSPTVSQVIDQRDIVKLPLNGREVQQLIFLAPGASNVTSSYCAFGCEVGIFPGEQYAKVNGATANGVSYQLDGVDYNDTYINTNFPFPNPDALQEFSLVTGNMSALYGNAIGGVVNVVTMSGTNNIHGDVFEFFRNAALDSRNWFADLVNPLKQNQFGGSIGGPVLKNRMFYFGTYQGTRTSTASNGQVAFVPSAAERTGDFSDLLPNTQLVNPNTGVPYPNNQIPVSPVAAYMLQHIPLPNGPDNQLTFDGAPDRQNTNEFMAKTDLNAGKHHLSGRYFQLNYTDPVVLPSPSNLLQVRGDAQHLVLKSVSAVDIYTLSEHFLLSSYYGYMQQNGQVPSEAPFGMADAGVNIAQSSQPVLSITVGSNFTLASVPVGNFTKSEQSLREVASLLKGNHELQFGGEIARIRLPMQNQFQEDGVFDFSNALTGNSLADFVTGAVSNFTQGGGLFINLTGYLPSLFLQDDWKATARLTLSSGLRWDPFFPYTDSEGRVACFVPGAKSVRFPNAPVGMLFGGTNHDSGCPASSIYNNLWNLAPRIGFAYQLAKNGKASIRGGAGYYYQPPNTVAFEDVVGIPPFAPIINVNNVSLVDPYGSAGIKNPFPAQFGPLNPGPNATFPASGISFTQIFDRHFRLPMVFAYNLTLERGFWSDWLLRLSYVGNTAHHLYGTGDQEYGLLQLNPPGDPVYPNYGSIASINSGVNSNYNAGQASLSKRFTHGLSLLTNFTWSKALDDFAPPTGGNFALTNSCACGRFFDYGPSPDDLRKVFNINGDFNVPPLHLPRAADKLLNGWELTAIANWNSGTTFTVFSGVDNSGSGIGADRADLLGPSVGSAVLSTGRSHRAQVNEWFDTAAFGVNAIGTYGNTGKGILHGPRFFDADLAAIKNARLTERISLEFRGEFYNAFNNVNFTNPDSVVTDSGFGQITGAGDPRIIQFGLKTSF
jgi:Carboxypeptidase regulatory-like domain/TonB-dependent Receptor Plug Domain